MTIDKPVTDISILVVDGNTEILTRTVRILKSEGYNVLSAPSGIDCKKLTITHKPDLVLLDVVLPDCDGRDLCKDIKSNPMLNGTHIILMSGLRTSPDEQADALEMGADAYITRPLSTRELRARIKAISRLILNEKELKCTRNISEGLIASMQDGFTELDVNGIHVNVNQAFLQMTGFSREDLIGWGTPHPYWPPEEYTHIEAAFQKTLAGEFSELELTFMRKNGKRFPVIVSPSSIKNDHGEVIRYFATVKDITEHSRAKEALIKSESRLREAQSIAKIGSWDMNAQTGEGIWSDELFILLGYNPGEKPATYSLFREHVHPDDVEKFEKNISEYTSRVKHVDETFRFVTTKAEIRIARSIGKVLFDEKGNPSRTYGTFQDITKYNKAEKALKKSERKYRQLVERINDVLYSINENGIVTYISPVVKNVLGYDPSEIIGKEFKEFIHRNDMGYVAESYMKVAVGDLEPSEYRLLAKTGVYHWVRSSSRPIYEENRFIGLSGVFSDISESKKLEDQLRQSQKMESIGNLAGGIAHDFNNILSSIIGFTELALDETPEGTMAEDSLQEVYAAGKRAKDLVKQILAFARQSDEKISPLQPSTIAKEILRFIRSTIPTTIEIQQEIESAALIMGNATQIHQVLMNLCTNAAHAMEDSGGVLTVCLKDAILNNKDLLIGMRPGNYLEIKVSDTGVGIAPELIASVFEPYFTTKGPGEGTGLGMAVAHGIVESYGGKITVESELGKGTTFKIYLPVTKKRSPGDSYITEDLSTGTERILFVDDEAPIAKMGSQILERLGYSVTTRTSSIEALELFQAKPNDFDLVVTDMTMPNLTGDKLAVELMKIRRDIPVILCTGYSKKISDETASEIGIKAFAYKPMVKADLAKTIRKVLDEIKG